jgi:hypothetical protein
MNPNDFDLSQASLALQAANTPLFLVRKLQEDPVTREIAENCSVEEILDVLRPSISADPTTAVEAVRPYALLVALWSKPDIGGLQEAVAIPAPGLSWYSYIGGALMLTFSPVQTQTIKTPGRLYSQSLVESSSSPTNQIIIVP